MCCEGRELRGVSQWGVPPAYREPAEGCGVCCEA